MWLSAVQYSTVQYSIVQYSTVQYSTVQYSTVQSYLDHVVVGEEEVAERQAPVQHTQLGQVLHAPGCLNTPMMLH